MTQKIAVIAIGGNSLIKDEKNVSVESQYRAAKETWLHISDVIELVWEVAFGYWIGPQVGFILRRSKIAARTDGMHRFRWMSVATTVRGDGIRLTAEPAKYSVPAGHQAWMLPPAFLMPNISAVWDLISERCARLVSSIAVRMRVSRSYRLDLYNHRSGVAFYDRPH